MFAANLWLPIHETSVVRDYEPVLQTQTSCNSNMTCMSTLQWLFVWVLYQCLLSILIILNTPNRHGY